MGKTYQHTPAKKVKQKNRTRVDKRTILESILCVAKYRDNYYWDNETGKRISLPEAAKGNTIPKKTLDDYYIQIKLAYMMGFDFSDIEGRYMKEVREYTGQFDTSKKVSTKSKKIKKMKKKKKAKRV